MNFSSFSVLSFTISLSKNRDNNSSNYNSLRAMASNIRSLHSSYGHCPFSTKHMIIEEASFSCYQMDSRTQQMKGPSQLAAVSNDGNLAVLLHWATASNAAVCWPDFIKGCADYSKGRKGILDRSRSRKANVEAVFSTPRSSLGTARLFCTHSFVNQMILFCTRSSSSNYSSRSGYYHRTDSVSSSFTSSVVTAPEPAITGDGVHLNYMFLIRKFIYCMHSEEFGDCDKLPLPIWIAGHIATSRARSDTTQPRSFYSPV